MSAKKNLTVAALAALLAVPAFGATNASHALHIPSVTAHADDSNMQARNEAFANMKRIGANTVSGGVDGGHAYVANVGGHSIRMNDSDTSIDGQPASFQQINALIGSSYGTNNQANSDNSNQSNSNSSNTADNNSNANGSTQYASKNSLPQTGESNDASKAMAMGAVALGASASMMALSMAKKHRQESELDSVSSEPTVNDGDGNGDDKSNNDDADDIDTGYHMIMSDMFDNISKDLKQM